MKKTIIFLILLLIPISVSAEKFPELSSKEVYIYDMKNNEILYEKASDEKALVASLTKIMTSIVAIENIDDLNKKVVMTKEILDYITYDLSIAKFKENEEVTYKDLLYGALLASGADATHALAVYISGSEEEFSNLMNNKAVELKLSNTHFTNSIGIESDTNDHFSTAKDFSKVLLYALKNKTFKKIFMTDVYKTEDGLLEIKNSRKKVEEKYNLDLKNITGYKTGYTSKAGLCMASISETKKGNLLLITLGADYNENKANHFVDATKVYDYYLNNYSYKTLSKKDKVIANIKTEYDEKVILKLNNDINKYIENRINVKKLEYIYAGDEILSKKVKKGDIIGKYRIYNGKELVYEEDVKSPIDVHFRLKNKYIILIVILVVIFSVLRFYIIKNKKVKKY